jgi:hypothetical protein
MSASVFAGMAGFADNFTKAYSGEKRRQLDDERQAKMDKITTDRADRETADWTKKDNYEKGLAAAGAPVAAEQPNDVLKDDDGNDMPAVPAFRAGTQRYATMAEAQGAADKASTPEATSTRQAAFMNANGKPLEALQMSNAVMDQQAKKMGLETAELEIANKKFNTDVLASLDADPDWTKSAANLLTKTQLGSMAGMTVSPSISTDGKTVSFVGTGPNGETKTLATMPNTPEGKLQFTQRILKATPEMKVAWLVENAKTAKAEIEAAQKQDNWGKEYTLREKEVTSKGELRVAQAEAAALRGSIAAGRANGSSNAGQGAPGVALKDRREYLADFANGLEDVKTAVDPKEAAAMQQRNQSKLVKADAIFSTNAELGNVLTAPQARAAMDMAQDPKNIRRVKDNATGSVYEVVTVNGKQVVVGTGELKTPVAETAKPANTTAPPNATTPSRQPVTMASVAASAPSSIDKIQAESIKAFEPLAAQVKQAESTFVAVAKSGDPVAIQRYIKEKEALRSQLESSVNAKFGNAAPKIMQQLLAQ